MPKLIRFLAVSACGGFLIGAGLRAGQTIAARPNGPEPATADQSADERIDERLGELERRVAATESEIEACRLEGQPIEERIARIESQLAGQSMAITELRECSLRNEETVRRLLGSLERLIEPRMSEPPEAFRVGARREASHLRSRPPSPYR